jgi:hypothetical protein
MTAELKSYTDNEMGNAKALRLLGRSVSAVLP